MFAGLVTAFVTTDIASRGFGRAIERVDMTARLLPSRVGIAHVAGLRRCCARRRHTCAPTAVCALDAGRVVEFAMLDRLLPALGLSR